ncbi:MAG: hypothetical protein QXH02_04595 [Desulfurococcaceae archaeon]
MPTNKPELVLLIAVSAVIALLFPLLVYYTYPATNESEVGLENILEDMLVKPPPFLVGSMGYCMHRGKELINRFTVKGFNHVVYVHRLDRNEPALFVLLPLYREENTGRVVTRNQLRQLISRENVVVLAEVFETHKGKVYVIVEARIDGEVYYAVKKFR